MEEFVKKATDFCKPNYEGNYSKEDQRFGNRIMISIIINLQNHKYLKQKVAKMTLIGFEKIEEYKKIGILSSKITKMFLDNFYKEEISEFMVSSNIFIEKIKQAIDILIKKLD